MKSNLERGRERTVSLLQRFNFLRPFARYIEENDSKRQISYTVVLLFICVLIQSAMLLAASFYLGEMTKYDVSTGSYNESDPRYSNRTVHIKSTEIDQLSDQYVNDTEKGWCVYGSYNNSDINITDVDLIEPEYATERRIKYNCLSSVKSDILETREYRLIGRIHSHPGGRSYMSNTDVFNFKLQSGYLELKGIYTEKDGLHVFTPESLSAPLELREY